MAGIIDPGFFLFLRIPSQSIETCIYHLHRIDKIVMDLYGISLDDINLVIKINKTIKIK
jgi:predicted aspartyl protease